MVLLKNDGVLPLEKGTLKNIAVIGPKAAGPGVLRANYYGHASRPVSILEGIQNEVRSAISVRHANGCPLALRVKETFSVETDQEAQSAIELAKDSDVVIFVGGLNAKLEGEEMRRAPDWIVLTEGIARKLNCRHHKATC